MNEHDTRRLEEVTTTNRATGTEAVGAVLAAVVEAEDVEMSARHAGLCGNTSGNGIVRLSAGLASRARTCPPSLSSLPELPE
jgi:hypothetical protein